ncbi:SRPBCC domain-containing protein [Tsukamurella sp. 8F]|uniref:SRPBCC domain-containing protein n=1 Tax=unclassified Tsukamurella TaxID=2633480 RepID=UPI0023BA1420|nr:MULTISPECIES: SRPBCC domain-containing protein [unclassified Tsukamurella]MDF0532593.1 SRPBCC domain-containing protein [Tsukamurella sp. 8J]MDF0589340.1 SRPBCC domain-containing protein [Tsukamurella sp. 8F]
MRYERRLRHPVEKVWRAITESNSLRSWFPTDITGLGDSGDELIFTFWPEAMAYATEEIGMPEFPATLTGKLLVWEPPETLEFRWEAERLRYELLPDADGTHLVLTVWLGSGADAAGTPDPAAGYHVCLARLAAAIDGRPSGMPSAADVHELETRYAEAFGVPRG